ncbi:MAG: permease-like cell division protein FtsX [Acidimicrobiales bacterium]|jgi:cell division transport system permease protein
MAIKLDYVIRETGSNLARNITITIASILTVMVSLFLVGFSLMVSQGVRNATERWQEGVEFVVFMNADATEEQISSVRADLESSPEVQRVTFVDKSEAYEEFKRLFSDSPELVDSVTPEILPSSFRVEPVTKDADVVQALGNQFQKRPGVLKVVFASDTIRLIQQLSSRLTIGMAVVAVILLGAALLLILNTIRMAMFARRREIEVQKLVGATNWFIRVPFMVEGLVQGIVGAAMAIVMLVVFRPFFESWLPEDEFPLFSALTTSSVEAFWIYVVIGVVGCLIGTIGAGVAVTRFLDV